MGELPNSRSLVATNRSAHLKCLWTTSRGLHTGHQLFATLFKVKIFNADGWIYQSGIDYFNTLCAFGLSGFMGKSIFYIDDHCSSYDNHELAYTKDKPQ